jgi:3-deoxy-manno-octulosonate cytidylyltransferase (CMP-KDO synthetase)
MQSPETEQFAVIIPARYQSSRLPGKPLVPLCGVPMIVRTWRQCVKVVPERLVFVATDDERIRATCAAHGIHVLMTSSACLTGTDRVAEAALLIDAKVYINVQGDEPVFNPADLTHIIESSLANPREVLNGVCAIADEAQYRSRSVPKVVMRPDGQLLYMSRGPIPANKSDQFVSAWRQICAYAFPKEALAAFTASPGKTPLEQLEDIEILRFIELGWKVRMITMSDESVAVDSPDDVLAAEAAIQARGL